MIDGSSLSDLRSAGSACQHERRALREGSGRASPFRKGFACVLGCSSKETVTEEAVASRIQQLQVRVTLEGCTLEGCTLEGLAGLYWSWRRTPTGLEGALVSPSGALPAWFAVVREGEGQWLCCSKSARGLCKPYQQQQLVSWERGCHRRSETASVVQLFSVCPLLCPSRLHKSPNGQLNVFGLWGRN